MVKKTGKILDKMGKASAPNVQNQLAYQIKPYQKTRQRNQKK